MLRSFVLNSKAFLVRRDVLSEVTLLQDDKGSVLVRDNEGSLIRVSPMSLFATRDEAVEILAAIRLAKGSIKYDTIH